MLQGVTALMSRHGSRRDGILRIDRLAEIHGLFHRIIVVGELARRADNFHVIDPVLTQHRLGHLGASHGNRHP